MSESPMRWFLIAFVVATGLYVWQGVGQRAAMREAKQLATDNPNGFVPVPVPANLPTGTVWVLAPVNCSSEAAARADDLVRALTAQGIPAARAARLSVQATEPNEEDRHKLQRLELIMKGTIPAVLIDGMAKANPSVEDTRREYERTRG